MEHKADSLVSNQPTDGDRREALKTFGRFAAAAPAAVMLLKSQKAEADDSYSSFSDG